ncbi:hypothetical protein OHA72_01895 [Dactylosporangium sp. NBC_01737]|uniref:hypothetical protein n=1 Tax=Dactylosporangium sp. NBC_01737 TaxID=2975959 RepID=UPI002E10E82F|nr:hypothetical protein OHA72_01895 [Dactylosporangium sp. NBC_01737]
MQRFWRIALVVVAVVAAFGATGLGVAYTLGVFTDAGRFRSAPDCAVLDASAVAAVVPAAKIEADGDNCTAGDGKTQLNVGFTVVSKKGTVGGPELASRYLDVVGGTDHERLDVGDQAIRQRVQAIGQPEIITMRVSNLIVVLSVANLGGGELPAAADAGLVEVARSLATKLNG